MEDFNSYPTGNPRHFLFNRKGGMSTIIIPLSFHEVCHKIEEAIHAGTWKLDHIFWDDTTKKAYDIDWHRSYPDKKFAEICIERSLKEGDTFEELKDMKTITLFDFAMITALNHIADVYNK